MQETNYAASKAELLVLQNQFALELGSRNIRCKCNCSRIETEMTAKLNVTLCRDGETEF
jgi:NAD(P)-dependent dehydrogenase (short-subunit alcohol dehydrogenase family)